jgi:hypothetical protein
LNAAVLERLALVRVPGVVEVVPEVAGLPQAASRDYDREDPLHVRYVDAREGGVAAEQRSDRYAED